MWSKFVFLFVIIASSSAQTQVSQCVHNSGELPIFTEVVGCANTPCALPQLEDVVLNIVFKSPRTIPTLRTLVTAYTPVPIIGELPIPYDLGENSHTCNFLTNSYCPVLEGEVVQYQLRMFIESFFPVGTQVTLEFRIVDASNTRAAIACIRVPIRIVDPRRDA